MNAKRQFEHVAELGREEASPEAALATAELALLEADPGDWEAARAHATAAQAIMATAGSEEGVTSVVSYLAAARTDLHWEKTNRRSVTSEPPSAAIWAFRLPPSRGWPRKQRSSLPRCPSS
jgi:hypothetical protein